MQDEHHNSKTESMKNTATASSIPVLEQLSIALGILLVIFGVTYIPEALQTIKLTLSEQSSNTNTKETNQETRNEDPFDTVRIEAQSVYIWDVRTQQPIFQKNPNDIRPLASVSKLMTALVAYDLLGETATIPISTEAVLQDGDSGLYSGEQFTLPDLTHMVLMNSSNDGAYALAVAGGASIYPHGNTAETFIEAMNLRADGLGLSRTSFTNPTGLDVSENAGGAYGSARDMASLMEYLITYRSEILEYADTNHTWIQNRSGESHEVQNTNTVLSNIPNVIASKTGYTDLAGGNLLFAYDAGLDRPVIIAILGSSYNGRFSDALKLIEATNTKLSDQ